MKSNPTIYYSIRQISNNLMRLIVFWWLLVGLVGGVYYNFKTLSFYIQFYSIEDWSWRPTMTDPFLVNLALWRFG